jgi:hypothetical protein
MPKLSRLISTNEADHLQGVTWLLDLIAKNFGKKHGDVVIAYHEDISVYAIRQWLKRPIPKRHYETLARLSELPMAEIEQIASKNFHSVSMRNPRQRMSDQD